MKSLDERTAAGIGLFYPHDGLFLFPHIVGSSSLSGLPWPQPMLLGTLVRGDKRTLLERKTFLSFPR